MPELEAEDVDVLVAQRWVPTRTDYVPGTTHDRLCARCGRLVALAPGSVRLLADMPTLRVLCVHCVVAGLPGAGHCPDCGHTHLGETFGRICVGCPCETR